MLVFSVNTVQCGILHIPLQTMLTMTRYSVLDLCFVGDNQTPADAFANSVTLAQHCEKLGFERFWLAEHHNMPGIASAATSLVISHVAANTSTIRLGAGGIMLPNHSPLQIAEQFGTLESLYPGRIDLGLGRAPGTDQATAYALRRNLHADVNQFPKDVVELQNYFENPVPGQKVHAVPGEGLRVPVWILGSSLFGAELAAHLGLPYAFASHFAPADLVTAIEVYRSRFRPSDYLKEPYLMLGYNVIAADTDEEAQYLATSSQQSFVNLQRGKPGKLPRPVKNFASQLDPAAAAYLQHVMSCSAVGTREIVSEKIDAFIRRTQPDEVMFVGNIFDVSARIASFTLIAELMRERNEAE